MDGWVGMVVGLGRVGVIVWLGRVRVFARSAQRERSRALVGLKTRLEKIAIHVSCQVRGPLRHAEPRPLGKEPRPSATAVGTTGAVHVVVIILVTRVLAVLDLGELVQCFE